MHSETPAETLDVVDDSNTVVGQASVDHIYENRLNHRIVQVLIFNEKGEVFLPQGSAQHKYCPGHWFPSASGHVLRGETYEQAAQRELSKWLGTSMRLTKIHEGPYDHYKMRKFMQVFRGISEGPFAPNNELSLAGRWFPVPVVLNMIRKNEMVHPELAHVLERLYSV